MKTGKNDAIDSKEKVNTYLYFATPCLTRRQDYLCFWPIVNEKSGLLEGKDVWDCFEHFPRGFKTIGLLGEINTSV